MRNWICGTPKGCQIFLHIQPAAKKSEVVGLHGEDRLKIKIKAPPEDGRANEELIRFLAEILELPKNEIEILRGHKSRKKDVLLLGKTVSAVQVILYTKTL